MSLLTRGCDSVLPGGLVGAQGEQQCLDGADEDPGQASVENDIEQQNFDCRGKEKERTCQWSCTERERQKVEQKGSRIVTIY